MAVPGVRAALRAAEWAVLPCIADWLGVERSASAPAELTKQDVEQCGGEAFLHMLASCGELGDVACCRQITHMLTQAFNRYVR